MSVPSVRNEVIHCVVTSVTPNLIRRIVWSMQSNAADKSSIPSRVTSRPSAAISMSEIQHCCFSWVPLAIRWLEARNGGARNCFLPGHYQGTIISNGTHFTVAQRPRKACKPGPFFKPVFPVSEFATNSTCLLCGMRWQPDVVGFCPVTYIRLYKIYVASN